MGADHEVAVVDHEVADRRGGHVQPQRLPMVAVIEGDVDGALGAREQQAASHGVLTHRVHDLIRRDSRHDFRPGLPAILGPKDVRVQIVEPQSIDSGISRLGVEVAGLEDGDLLERLHLRGRDIGPLFPAIG